MKLSAAVPVISVIIATYNRSHTLRHAIQSVCNSTLTDWELVIVGDGCTDDSAECVASFKDARINFVNLHDRCGDQSGPNNHGVLRSRGRFLAFLNHDDFYFPDHLANGVRELEESGADLVWGPTAGANARKRPEEGDWPLSFSAVGVPFASEYSPLLYYPASSWVMRRDLASRVGPWRSANSTYLLPSQEWLFRASRMGAKLRFISHVGVIKVEAIAMSYTYQESAEHDWIAHMLTTVPGFRESVLEQMAIEGAGRIASNAIKPSLWTLVQLLRRPVYALLLSLGLNPTQLNNAIRAGRRGGDVLKHRRKTGSI